MKLVFKKLSNYEMMCASRKISYRSCGKLLLHQDSDRCSEKLQTIFPHRLCRNTWGQCAQNNSHHYFPLLHNLDDLQEPHKNSLASIRCTVASEVQDLCPQKSSIDVRYTEEWILPCSWNWNKVLFYLIKEKNTNSHTTRNVGINSWR